MRNEMRNRFTDSTGSEWQIDIDVAAMRRAKKAGVDLSMPVNQLREFFMDDVFLIDCLWSIVSVHAKGLTADQFDSRLNGGVLVEAREALWAGLEAYFDPGKAEMLRAAVETFKAEMANAVTTLTGSIEPKANLDTTSEASPSPNY